MTAWVLIVSLGLNGGGYAINGLADEQACKELKDTLQATYIVPTPLIRCFQYRAATRAEQKPQ